MPSTGIARRSRPLLASMGVALVVVLASSSCAGKPEPSFWTRKGANDKQFRKISLACNEQASDTVAKEGSGGCTYTTEGRGTFCTDVNRDDPFAVEQEKRRIERRLRYLYSQCLEASGWTANDEGRGYKGRH